MLFFCSLRKMLKITSNKTSQTETNIRVSQANRGYRGKREAAQRGQKISKSKDICQTEEPAEVRTSKQKTQTFRQKTYGGQERTRKQPHQKGTEKESGGNKSRQS